MVSVEDTQTPQPSWHVQARPVGLLQESYQNDHILTSSIPPDSLLPGDDSILLQIPVKDMKGSQALSSLPIHPIPKEMRTFENNNGVDSVEESGSELFSGTFRHNERGDYVQNGPSADAIPVVQQAANGDREISRDVDSPSYHGVAASVQVGEPENQVDKGEELEVGRDLPAHSVMDENSNHITSPNGPDPPRPTWKATPPAGTEPLPSPRRTPSIPSPDPPALARLPSMEEDQLKSDPQYECGQNHEETPDIPSPQDSPKRPQTPSSRPRRAAAQRSKTPAAALSPENPVARPITAHDPSPIRSSRKTPMPKSASKITRTVERTFKRTASAPSAVEQDSFGEAPRLAPRRRIERYLTASPSKSAVPPIEENEDAGEATDQESVKRGNTVSQSLILDEPESVPKVIGTNGMGAYEPTLLNTMDQEAVDIPGHRLHLATSPRSSLPNGNARQSSPVTQATHVNTSPHIDDLDEEDLPGSPTPRRHPRNRLQVPSDEETENSEPLFTASGAQDKTPLGQAGRSRFARMVSSSNGSDRDFNIGSQLFGNGSEKDFGSEDHTQSEPQMAATQAVRSLEQSSPAPPLPRPSPILLPSAVAPNKAVSHTTSGSSNSARSNIAPHRRLMRQRVPSGDPPVPQVQPRPFQDRQTSTGPRALRTAPLPVTAMNGFEPTQISQPIRSAPMPTLSGLEPTQVSQSSDPVSREAGDNLQEDTIDVKTGKDIDIPSSPPLVVNAAADLLNSSPIPPQPSANSHLPSSMMSPPPSAIGRPPVPSFSAPTPVPSSPFPAPRDQADWIEQNGQSTNKTLPPTPPPKRQPTKMYGTPKKGKRKSFPSKKAREAEEVQQDVDMMSDVSSGSSVSRDPNDETFRPNPKGKKPGRLAKATGRSKMTHDEASSATESEEGDVSEDHQDDDEESDLEAAPSKLAKQPKLPTYRLVPKKRKTPMSARGKSGREVADPDSDGGSSGTTPVDEEDDTYRPTKNLAKRGRVKTNTSNIAGTSRGSSVPTADEVSVKGTKVKAGRTVKKQKNRRSTDVVSADVHGALGGPSIEPIIDAPIDSPVAIGKQILGYWKTTTQYYAGTIQGEKDGEFEVLFYDGAQATLTIDRLRLFEIREGDTVRTNERNKTKHAGKVLEAYTDDPRGVRVVLDKIETYITLPYLYISAATVNKDWSDRMVEPADLGLNRNFNLIRSGHRTSSALSGKIFLITINVSDPDGSIRKALESGITSQGGKIAADWSELFEPSDDGFWSKLVTKDAPFLLVHGSDGAKPKTLAALAAGIPCISADYIAHITHREVDWRGYLVSPGRSVVHGQYTSQLIDPCWGEPTWNPSLARNSRQFLAGMKLLFVIPQKNDNHHLISLLRKLVPFCLHALGASSLEQINTAPATKDVKEYDFVIVEDRGNLKIPASWTKRGNVCNVIWLKQCLIAGCLLPAEIAKENK